MAGSSNNSSFIPKRGTTKRKRKVRNGNVYVLTIVAYVVLFATLLASGAIYLYQQYVNGQLENEISEMNSAVSGFKEADMQRVQEFDIRLRQAHERLDHAASVTAILEALELSVIDSVRLSSLDITRNQDSDFLVEAEVQTNDFDSTIFQRGVFTRGQVIDVVEIDDVNLNEISGFDTGGELLQSVTFITKLAVPLDAVLYDPAASVVEPLPVPQSPVTETPTEATELIEGQTAEDVNQNDL